jgi:hypothetical protein
MHLARRNLLRQSRKSDGNTIGTFALRSPVRPNPISSSIVNLVEVRPDGLLVRGLDCVDGSPLIDIKPERCPGHRCFLRIHVGEGLPMQAATATASAITASIMPIFFTKRAESPSNRGYRGMPQCALAYRGPTAKLRRPPRFREDARDARNDLPWSMDRPRRGG